MEAMEQGEKTSLFGSGPWSTRAFIRKWPSAGKKDTVENRC
jgi:hypothetical protein